MRRAYAVSVAALHVCFDSVDNTPRLMLGGVGHIPPRRASVRTAFRYGYWFTEYARCAPIE